MRFSPNLRRIAAIHDLSGVGRTSLLAVIPILSTMGFNVCPLPTAILSNHSQYPDFSFLDLTDEMPKIIRQWAQLGVRFDAIYTGYRPSVLMSSPQISRKRLRCSIANISLSAQRSSLKT